jgi:hypothetical protein
MGPVPHVSFETPESTNPFQPSFSLHKIPSPRLTIESSRLQSPARPISGVTEKTGTPPYPPGSGAKMPILRANRNP